MAAELPTEEPAADRQLWREHIVAFHSDLTDREREPDPIEFNDEEPLQLRAFIEARTGKFKIQVSPAKQATNE